VGICRAKIYLGGFRRSSPALATSTPSHPNKLLALCGLSKMAKNDLRGPVDHWPGKEVPYIQISNPPSPSFKLLVFHPKEDTTYE
jgi:hypothetical protein